MKLAEFNRFSYERSQDPTAKPPLIRNFNLAAMTTIGALNGIYRVENGTKVIENSITSKPIAETILSPWDKKFYELITSVKNDKLKKFAKKFQKWLSPENQNLFIMGNKMGISINRLAKGAALMAAIYTIPKLVIYQINKIKEKQNKQF